MFVTKNQFFIFLACLTFGGVSGFLFNISYAIKLFVKNRIVQTFIDIIISLPIGFAFANYSFAMNFPSLRVYMLVGIFVGIYLYFKSFYIILANLAKKIYNIFEKKFKRARNVRKAKRKSTNNRRKGKKVNSGKHGGGGIVDGYTFNGDGLSINIHRS